jgi:hypothetical protein
MPIKEYDWLHTCYKGATELLPDNAPPKPLGKPIVTTSYVNANLYHDLISGRSITGILHLWNSTPIDWYSKLQGAVEMATFSSKYIAMRTCMEQIINHCTLLRYLGIPVEGAAMMFRDNELVINTASTPHGKLHKRHNALAFHRMREAIATNITRYHPHINGKKDPSNIL